MDAIDEHVKRYPGSPVLLDVLGSVDAATIRERVLELDPEAAEVFFFGASVGALFGIRRHDGSRVAMKIHKLFTNEIYFEAVQAIQSALADVGFPAPRPLGRHGAVTWEQWLDAGSFRDGHDPEVRRAMAATLVRFHGLATRTGLRPRSTAGAPVDGTVWPVPHNALFDFAATTSGAEWIDEIGRAALPIGRGDTGDEVVGHTDWSAKHLRFDDDLQPTALYDWDSVNTSREPTLVGTAAGSFTYTEELSPPVARWPSAEESLAFIEDYEQARGKSFSAQERHAAHAACVYLRAYATRCYHAYGGDAHQTDLSRVADLLL
jgi:Phosphotransferase enzyme family